MAILIASAGPLPGRRGKQVCRRDRRAASSGRPEVCAGRKSQSVPCRSGAHGPGHANDLIASLMPLVRRVAGQLRGRLPAHVELDDLVSAGSLGLIDAVRKFEPRKGVTVERYARFRIRGAILDSLRDEDPASRDMRRRIKKIERVCQDLEFELGRPARDAEIARAMGLSLGKWNEMVAELQGLGFEGTGAKSFQAVRQRVDEENLADLSATDPFALCYRREQRDIFRRALSCLSERERSIMRLYYQQSLTMKQIGTCLGIDESRVSQLHSAALIRLRARVSHLVETPRAGWGAKPGASLVAQP